MKKFVITIAFLISVFSLTFAQKLTEDDLPPGLLYEFQNRYPGVKHSEWEMSNDQYIGKFNFMGNSVVSYYDISTAWLFSETNMTVAQLPRITQKHISSSLSEYEVKKVQLIEQRKDEDYYRIETKKGDEFFYLIYDKVGVFSKVADRYGNAIMLETEKSFEGRKEVSIKEVPSPISSYISTKYDGFNVGKSYFINNQEYENVYYITLNKLNDKKEVILLFDFRGELLSENNPYISETQQYSNIEKSRRSEIDEPIDEADIPQNIKDDFSKKVRNPEMVIWNKTNESYYVSYIDVMKMQRNVLEYNMEGEWVKTSTELRQKEINQNIVKYVKDNYPGLKIYSAANVSAAPRERYVFVKIFNSKWQNDPMVYHELYFSTAGKLEKAVLAEYIEGTSKSSQKVKQREQDDSFFSNTKHDNISLRKEYTSVSIRELPTQITKHIGEEYPTYVIQECFLIPNEITEILEYVVTIRLEGYRTQKKLRYDYKGEFIESKDF